MPPKHRCDECFENHYTLCNESLREGNMTCIMAVFRSQNKITCFLRPPLKFRPNPTVSNQLLGNLTLLQR